VYWKATAEACTSVLTPWYLGITETPECYYRQGNAKEQLTAEYHLDPPAGTLDYDPNLAWWAFKDLQDLVNKNRDANVKKVRAVWDEFEAEQFAEQAGVDRKALSLYSQDETNARAYLTEYSHARALEAVDIARRLTEELRGESDR